MCIPCSRITSVFYRLSLLEKLVCLICLFIKIRKECKQYMLRVQKYNFFILFSCFEDIFNCIFRIRDDISSDFWKFKPNRTEPVPSLVETQLGLRRMRKELKKKRALTIFHTTTLVPISLHNRILINYFTW